MHADERELHGRKLCAHPHIVNNGNDRRFSMLYGMYQPIRGAGLCSRRHIMLYRGRFFAQTELSIEAEPGSTKTLAFQDL
jgi:hypothetical protein